MDTAQAIEEIRKQANRDTEVSRELAIKFFFHWALLSGAAITLFISFLSSEVVHNNITPCSKLYTLITFVSFIVSMFFSSMRNFVMGRDILKLARAKHKMANELSSIKESEKYSGETPIPMQITEILGYIAIVAFIVGIISAYIFISKVIF